MNNQNSSSITPMDLFGAKVVFTTREVKDRPIIANGKKYLFHDAVEINISKMEFMTMKPEGSDKEVPGVMINKGGNDQMFVTMDEKLHTNRDFVIELAKGWNTQKLNEIIADRDEAERVFNECDEAAKKFGKIIELMK